MLVSVCHHIKCVNSRPTNSLVSYLAALLCIQGPRTVLDSQELHESVRLLDGDLRNLSVGVEDMEDVALRHLLARKVPWKAC